MWTACSAIMRRTPTTRSLGADWVAALARLYTPTRYPLHCLQMGSAYLVQIVPASTIENCVMFQAADQLRWVSRAAYRTRELANAHADAGFVTGERKAWEEDPCWQGFRELLERVLATYDWAEHFIALNIVAKPAFDEACVRQLVRSARGNRDTLLAQMLDAQWEDSERSRRWTGAPGRIRVRDGRQRGHDGGLGREVGAARRCRHRAPIAPRCPTTRTPPKRRRARRAPSVHLSASRPEACRRGQHFRRNDMRKVMIGGTGMTRFGKFLDTNLRALAAEAATAALADADTAADEVGMVFFGNAAGGLLGAQECVRGQVALRHTGLLGKPIVNVENACASSSTAFHLAVLAVGSGQCDVALAVGAEKMSNEDRTVPLKALEAAADRDEFEELKKRIAPGGAGSGSVFMDLYSNLARDFAERTGATPADYARVSVKQRRAGALNGKAQFQEAVTVEDVLESRMIAEPLTLMMCSPIGDGAAALVLMSEDYAQRKALNPVAVLASELRSGQGDDPEAPPVAEVAGATAAYETAGLGPEDISVAEIHDAAAPAELMLSEQLKFCRPGDAVGLLRDGVTALEGRMPINPSGGAHQQGPPDRCDRRGATCRARRPDARPLWRAPAGRRAVRPRRERRRLDRRGCCRRLCDHSRVDPPLTHRPRPNSRGDTSKTGRKGMSESAVLVETAGRAGVITINRPERSERARPADLPSP